MTLLSLSLSLVNSKTSSPTFALCLVTEQCLAYGTNSSLTILELRNETIENSSDKQVLELNSQIYYLTSLPNGELIVCGCVEEYHVITKENHVWVKGQTVCLNGYGLINSLSLSPDGTKLITSSINGLIDLFEIKWKKSLISQFFEINFIGNNQISIKNGPDLPDNVNVLIRSKYEIKKVKILKRRYAIVWTKNSLIFSDLEVASSSNLKKFNEIDWNGMSSNELRFCFDYENVLLINVIGELYIYQISNGQLLTSVRTDFISPHLMRYLLKRLFENLKLYFKKFIIFISKLN